MLADLTCVRVLLTKKFNKYQLKKIQVWKFESCMYDGDDYSSNEE